MSQIYVRISTTSQYNCILSNSKTVLGKKSYVKVWLSIQNMFCRSKQLFGQVWISWKRPEIHPLNKIKNQQIWHRTRVMFNRPGVAGAVLLTALWLINWFSQWVSLFLQIFIISKITDSKSRGAKILRECSPPQEGGWGFNRNPTVLR